MSFDSIKLSEDELQVVKALLRDTAGSNEKVAADAMHNLAKAVELPLRKGYFSGDTVGGIFLREDLEPGTTAKYPVDFIGPSGEREYQAWKIADEGRLPDRLVRGTEVAVDVFELGNAISWKLQYARDARWNMVERALKVFRDGFTMKKNTLGWTLLTKAAGNRVDTKYSTVTGAAFTLGLLSDMQLKMKRGIDFARNELTDLFVSSEVMRDIRNFATTTSIDYITRREIFTAAPRTAGDGAEIIIPNIYGVNIHENKELGLERTYNTKFNDGKGSYLSGFDSTADEVVIGLDLTPEGREAFMMPVKRDLEVFEETNLHREQKAGVYGWMELAFAVLDDRRCMPGWIDV
jgi:hypothetical protein